MDPSELSPSREPGPEPGEPQGTDTPGGQGGSAAAPSPVAHALSEVPDVILMFRVSPEGRLLCESAMSSQPTAPVLQTLVGHAIEELLPRDVLQRFGERYDHAAATREPARYEESLRQADAALEIEATLTPIFDDSGRPSHLFWSVRDISEQRSALAALHDSKERFEAEQRSAVAALRATEERLEAEQRAAQTALRETEERLEAEQRAARAALRESEERFKAFVDSASIGIAWTDPGGQLLEVNAALCDLVGRPADRLLSMTLSDLVHADDRDGAERVLAELGHGLSETAETEIRLVHEEGTVLWARADVALVRDGAGEAQRVVWQFQDQTERRGLQERLAHQSLHDPLTGLPNRALFLDRLGHAISRLDRNASMVAAIILDLDHFDSINDAHGHETGDRYLRGLGEKLQARVRQGDTLARLGSDEFAFIAEDLEGHDDATAVAARIREAVEEPVNVEGTGFTLTASIGVAMTSQGTDRPEPLLRDAGMALAHAKSAGHSRTVIFDESMRAEAAKRVKTEADLQRAIEQGEFRVFYQPQVNLKTGRIVGAEVLARWQHPDRGLVTPVEFIALAEKTGLIVPLGTWVLEEACRQSERWRALRAEPLMTWVNISPRQLAEPRFTDTVEKVLAETGADPSSICLEVTEEVLLEEAGTAVTVLNDLKGLGLKVGIDDFGKGFSSLAYLKRLPVDMLKLDRTFVGGLAHSDEDRAIVAAVINLARAMGLTSIAEGVESPEQLAALRELGCDFAQGYFFSNPQPPEVIAELLSQNLRW